METSLHSHIIGIHIQERIAFAERERLARGRRRPVRPRHGLGRLRLTGRRRVGKVVAGP